MLIMLLIMSRKEKKTEDLVTFVKPLHLPFFNRKTLHKIEPDVTQSMRLVRNRESPVFNFEVVKK